MPSIMKIIASSVAFLFGCLLIGPLQGESSEEKRPDLRRFIQFPKKFSVVSADEWQKKWSRVTVNHQRIVVGMTAKEVVGVLGYPDWKFDPKGKPIWVRPNLGLLQYSRWSSAGRFYNFTVYFRKDGRVAKTERNGPIFTTAPMR
jgi:hypothetical protein